MTDAKKEKIKNALPLAGTIFCSTFLGAAAGALGGFLFTDGTASDDTLGICALIGAVVLPTALVGIVAVKAVLPESSIFSLYS